MNILAIHGGQPIRTTFLPYGKQAVDEGDIQAVVHVLQGDYLTTGPNINDFETYVASRVGARYAVAFSNGTAALHGACYAAGISHGDEVITSPMTFAASANCVLYLGGTPVFCDINEMDGNIDSSLIEHCITPRTKAIIPVDFTGNPVNLDVIMPLARKYNLIVIEDAAHALGATYKGAHIGSIADMTMFSFHPVKHITTGEGGMITTNSEDFRDKLIQFRTHGITRDASKLVRNHGPWYYEMQQLGYNYRITDIQAALGSSQLRKLDSFIQRRREIVQVYNREFSRIDTILTRQSVNISEASWHLYIIQLNLEALTVGRREIFEALLAENIGVNVHYLPVHMHPYYESLGYQRGICPVSEAFYERIITLPLFPAMTEQDVLDVIRAVTKVLAFYTK